MFQMKILYNENFPIYGRMFTLEVNIELECNFIVWKKQSPQEETETLVKEMQDEQQRHSQKQVCRPSSFPPTISTSKNRIHNNSVFKDVFVSIVMFTYIMWNNFQLRKQNDLR